MAEKQAKPETKPKAQAKIETKPEVKPEVKPKSYKVIGGAVTLANRRDVAKLGEVWPEEAFVSENIPALIEGGYLAEV